MTAGGSDNTDKTENITDKTTADTSGRAADPMADEGRADATRVFPTLSAEAAQWGPPADPAAGPWTPPVAPVAMQQPGMTQPGMPQPGMAQPWGAPPVAAGGRPPQQPWVAPQAAKPKQMNRFLVILTVVALVGLAAIVSLVTAVFYLGGSKKLDHTAAQDGVKKVLTSDYSVQNLGAVTCPSDITVSAGGTFVCTVVVDGNSTQVTAKFTSDDGTYEVGRPN